MLKPFLAATAVGVALIATTIAAATTTIALPLAPSAAGPSIVSAPVVQAHYCHHGIQRSVRDGVGVYGWHFHDRACLRHDTAPPGYANGSGVRGSHVNPRCSYRCRFVGPVKMCEPVCR